MATQETHETEGSSRDPREDLRERAREIRHEGEALARSSRRAFEDIDALARDQMERRPYAALGAIFAAGYILGGGLPPRLMGFAFGIGARVAAMTLAGQLAKHAVED